MNTHTYTYTHTTQSINHILNPPKPIQTKPNQLNSRFSPISDLISFSFRYVLYSTHPFPSPHTLSSASHFPSIHPSILPHPYGLTKGGKLPIIEEFPFPSSYQSVTSYQAFHAYHLYKFLHPSFFHHSTIQSLSTLQHHFFPTSSPRPSTPFHPS